MIQLDNKSGQLIGGTGESFDWNLIPPKKIEKLMLSGGIDKYNLREALRTFEPDIIDINSKVEDSPGFKSKEKLKSFFEEADRIRNER